MAARRIKAAAKTTRRKVAAKKTVRKRKKVAAKTTRRKPAAKAPARRKRAKRK